MIIYYIEIKLPTQAAVLLCNLTDLGCFLLVL